MTDEQPQTPLAAGGIPCTVKILTRNSVVLLERCLTGLEAFAEVIVCDGRSTDHTVAFARSKGCRVVEQPEASLDDEGRLIDYSGARNVAIEAAEQPWLFQLDSDEQISPELVDEIRLVLAGVSDDIDAFEVPFRYVIGNRVITTASTYPGYQLRLFRNTLRYRNLIHESVEVDPDRVSRLENFYCRFPPGPLALIRRWVRYGFTEARPYSDLSSWWRGLGVLRLRRARWSFRAYRALATPRSKSAMPRRYELIRPATELGLVLLDIPAVIWRWVRRR